jgi:trehalose-6-phosphate synthase
MPIDERRGRQNELLNILSQNDLKLWGERFITSLARPVASEPWPRQRAAIASGR